MAVFLFGLFVVMIGMNGLDNNQPVSLCISIAVIGLAVMFASLPLINRKD